MMYKKVFAKNNKKPKANPKRKQRKSQSANAVNLPLKNKKTTKKQNIKIEKEFSVRSITMILLVTAIGLIILYHQSITIYWQQTYHFDPFHSNARLDKDALELEETPNIQAVATALQTSEHLLADETSVTQSGIAPLTSENQISATPKLLPKEVQKEITVIEKENIKKAEEIDPKVSTDLKIDSKNEKNDSKSALSPQHHQLPPNNKPEQPIVSAPLPILLTSNDKVFFAGDSLMQGVAPYVKKMLFKQYKIESIDLSKQSTGLAYPKAFNWPKAIEDNLAADPSIKLLVVFLGPNDPWDFPVEGYTQYARFKSELWEAQYRLRIDSVINSAKAHNANVLWLAAPCMRKPKLNDGMVYLNSLYQSELTKVQQHFLTTNELLGCTYEKFNSFVETDNEKIKVRIDDGIHFTPTGQKILAKAIMDQITFKELEDTNND